MKVLLQGNSLTEYQNNITFRGLLVTKAFCLPVIRKDVPTNPSEDIFLGIKFNLVQSSFDTKYKSEISHIFYLWEKKKKQTGHGKVAIHFY